MKKATIISKEELTNLLQTSFNLGKSHGNGSYTPKAEFEKLLVKVIEQHFTEHKEGVEL